MDLLAYVTHLFSRSMALVNWPRKERSFACTSERHKRGIGHRLSFLLASTSGFCMGKWVKWDIIPPTPRPKLLHGCTFWCTSPETTGAMNPAHKHLLARNQFANPIHNSIFYANFTSSNYYMLILVTWGRRQKKKKSLSESHTKLGNCSPWAIYLLFWLSSNKKMINDFEILREDRTTRVSFIHRSCV